MPQKPKAFMAYDFDILKCHALYSETASLNLKKL